MVDVSKAEWDKNTEEIGQELNRRWEWGLHGQSTGRDGNRSISLECYPFESERFPERESA